jgi:hypothetical protein
MPSSYFPLDVNFFDHPKVVPLGDTAVRLHLSAIGYANRLMTDGFIAHPIPRRLGAVEGHVDELVRAVLWHPADAPCPRGHDDTCPKMDGVGWRIHDFLEHNRSKVERMESQESERKRKAAWRQRQRESRNGPPSSVTPLSRGTPASRGRPGDGQYRDRDRDIPTHPEEYGPPAVIHTGSVENLSQSSQRRAKLRDPISVADALAPVTGQKPTRPTRDQLRWREEHDNRAAAERILVEGGAS